MSETWGSASAHERYMVPYQAEAYGRRRCRQPGCKNNWVTHVGCANGVALMDGCEWHVRQWVKGS